MSPEQLDGRPADARADIFAFGAVLYEMTSGRKAFTASNHSSLMAAIREHDPPRLSNVPPNMDRTIRTCLAKDPDDRWQNVRDLLHELTWIADAAHEPQGNVSTESLRRTRLFARIAGIAAGVMAVALGALGYRYFNRVIPLALPARFELSTPATSDPLSFALSPDGRYVTCSRTGERCFEALAQTTRPAGRANARRNRRRELSLLVSRRSRDRLLRRWKAQTTQCRRQCSTCSRRRVGRTRRYMEPRRHHCVRGHDRRCVEPYPRHRRDTESCNAPCSRPGKSSMASVSPRWQPLPVSLDAWPVWNSGSIRRIARRQSSEARAGGRCTGDFCTAHTLVTVRQSALVALRFDPLRHVVSGEPRSLAQPIGFDASTVRGAFAMSDSGVLAYHGHCRATSTCVDRPHGSGCARDRCGGRQRNGSTRPRARRPADRDLPHGRGQR